jgi:hypothetical protein
MIKQTSMNKKPASQKTSKRSGRTAAPNEKIKDRSGFAFDKDNYKWLLVGLGFLLVGFLLMIGGGSDDPDVFNDAMFDFQRLTLSPILLMIGYMLGIYAIMKKPKIKNKSSE